MPVYSINPTRVWTISNQLAQAGQYTYDYALAWEVLWLYYPQRVVNGVTYYSSLGLGGGLAASSWGRDLGYTITRGVCIYNVDIPANEIIVSAKMVLTGINKCNIDGSYAFTLYSGPTNPAWGDATKETFMASNFGQAISKTLSVPAGVGRINADVEFLPAVNIGNGIVALGFRTTSDILNEPGSNYGTDMYTCVLEITTRVADIDIPDAPNGVQVPAAAGDGFAGGVVGGNTLCWFIADFIKYIVMCNGGVTLIRSYDGVWSVHDNSVIPLANAICNANGRVFLGGFADAPTKVIWSTIGAIKFITAGDTDTALNNTAGERVMMWEGEVLAVFALAARCVVLGTGGVSLLIPAAVDSAPGAVGLVEVSAVGVGSGFACANTRQGLYYINLNNELCFLGTTETKEKVLDFSGYLTWDSRLSFDENLQELYINNGTVTYVLNKQGMGTISHPLSAVLWSSKLRKLFVHSASVIAQTDMEIESDELTLGYVGNKTVEDIAVTGDNLSHVYVCIVYKRDGESSYVQTPWRRANKTGWARIGVTVDRCRVKVKVSNYAGTELIRDVKIGYKTTDKRFVKGVTLYGNQAST